MIYLVDANVLITAHRQWYGFDFCPGFWDWLVTLHARGELFSVARVQEEIRGASDELAGWVASLPATFFLAERAEDAPAFDNLRRWAAAQGYESAGITDFMHKADAALIAQASWRRATVVTQEVRSAGRRVVKIPDACIGVGVRYATTPEMLRASGARLRMGSAT